MKKIYAVKKGRIPGLYLDWKDCEKQVKNFPKADFRLFEYKDGDDFEAVRKIALDYINGTDDSSTESGGIIYDFEDFEVKGIIIRART